MAHEFGGDRRVEDEHFFVTSPAGRELLYAFTHVPRDVAPSMGVVIASPIGRERLRICHEVPSLGRDLAAAGFAVMRFDYRGEGESGGQFRDAGIWSRVDDTIAAVQELRARTRVERVALLGFHAGAAIAVLAAERAAADVLILCEPLCDTRGYARTLLRASVLQQTQHFGKPAVSDADIRAALAAGDGIPAFGFTLTRRLIDELEALDVSAAMTRFGGSSLIAYFDANGAPPRRNLVAWSLGLGAPVRCDTCVVPMGFSWTTRKRWRRRFDPLNDRITAWLQRTAASPEPLAAMAARDAS